MTIIIDFVTISCIIVVSIKLQVWREANTACYTNTIFIEIKEYFIEKLKHHSELAEIYILKILNIFTIL